MMDPTETPQNDAQAEPDPGPFADPGVAQGAAQEPEKPFNWWGLRNSDPPLEPRNVGQQLDMAAEWYEHLFTGFLKQSNSGGTEAWMHYVVASILLADQELGLLDDDEKEAVTERNAEAWDGDEP